MPVSVSSMRAIRPQQRAVTLGDSLKRLGLAHSVGEHNDGIINSGNGDPAANVAGNIVVLSAV